LLPEKRFSLFLIFVTKKEAFPAEEAYYIICSERIGASRRIGDDDGTLDDNGRVGVQSLYLLSISFILSHSFACKETE
jgi:hypothetical protein